MVFELDASSDLGKQGVVFAKTDILTRAKPLAALSDEDRPTGNDTPVKSFNSETLRVAVTAVP